MKKIMFNDKFGLTQAVLDGRKTQTRRMCKEQHWAFSDLVNAKYGIFHFDIPKYEVGEVVAVAQSYKDAGFNPDMLQTATINGNIGDYPISRLPGWGNKMFTFPSMMPHRIRITNVRVERLQDISDEECLAEGIYKDECKTFFSGYAFETSKDQHGYVLAKKWYKTPREAYAALIDKISGKGAWESNPFVFVYDFELIK